MAQLGARSMARVFGYYTSSGSEHDGGRDSDWESDRVDWFLEESWQGENNEVEEECGSGDDAESTQRVDSAMMDLSEEKLHRLVSGEGDQYRNRLVSEVHQVLENINLDHRRALRSVMSELRNLGHNAAVCKSRWDSSGGLVSGSHEFIDIILTPPRSAHLRYLIDLDFASKFEIARPTESYKRLLSFLPGAAFVGSEDELKKIVKVMSDAAKRSLKSRDLHLPPWRKNRYMQMKWFGPYKRTTNDLPASSCGGGGGGEVTWKVECRAVGFNPVCDGVKGRCFVRTR